MERETGIEPATNSLEGCDSTIELLPPDSCRGARGLFDTRLPILGEMPSDGNVERPNGGDRVIRTQLVVFVHNLQKTPAAHWLTSANCSDKILKVLIYQRFVGDGSRWLRGFAP